MLVFVGSGFGGALRYGVNLVFVRQRLTGFPWSTLCVNVLASFVIGLLFAYAYQKHALSQQQYLLLAAGFCGGLSTFSTFAIENQLMVQQHQYLTVVLYTVVSVLLCVAATYAGKALA